jgi:hypothetical protein
LHQYRRRSAANSDIALYEVADLHMTSQQDVTTCMALPFPAAFLMAARPLPILRKRQCGPVAVVQTLHRGFRLLVGVDVRGGAQGQLDAVDLSRGRLYERFLGAGHGVGHDQPERCCRLLREFVTGTHRLVHQRSVVVTGDSHWPMDCRLHH